MASMSRELDGENDYKTGKVRSRMNKIMRTMREMMIEGGAVVVSGSADIEAMFKELYEREVPDEAE